MEQESRPVTDALVLSLIETTAGKPLAMSEVRESIDHLYGLGRYDDVQVLTETVGAGLRVIYRLMPAHPIQEVVFRGTLGLSEAELRQAVMDRVGALPEAGRVPEVASTLVALYREHGYLGAKVTPVVEESHDPDLAVLILNLESGARAPVGDIRVEGITGADRDALLARLAVRPGRPYDSSQLVQALERYETELRERGYYEARAIPSTDTSPSGAVNVVIDVDRGPLVTIAFAGDDVPEDVRALVPVREEASVDEDLLENAALAIDTYYRARGYRDSAATYARTVRGSDELVVTFTVLKGRRHVVEAIQVGGNTAMTADEVRALLRLKEGEPFVQLALEQGATAVRQTYRSRGYTRAFVEPVVAALPQKAGGGDVPVHVNVQVTEGQRTLVGAVVLEGQQVLSEASLRALMRTAPGQPYSDVQAAADRDRIQNEYLDRGYRNAVLDLRVTLAENDTRANIRFGISEGPQIVVDHVIIVGNERIRTETIERELTIRSGQPLGYSAVVESQQRLAALGLFRRIRITEREHGSEPRRDVVIEVEESAPTTLGYGGGFEGGLRLRTAEGGQAEEHFELAPRGFFEIGRRNLFGKNRSINLFTRVSLRARNIVFTPDGIRLERPQAEQGFNEYRVVGTYREPRIFDSRADLQVITVLDQSARSSFNFRTREASAQAGVRLSPSYSASGTYSYTQTELFDEQFTDQEKPLIDRLFPQVLLSTMTGTLFRDSRNDVLDPERGSFMAIEGNLAARAVGSEVGFVKTYAELFTYRRLPALRRAVLALAARFGAAHGFARMLPRRGPLGNPVLGPDGRPLVDTVQDLPASKRFFAGGDTTVRGFSLDRLGDEETITPTGFPTGGNGLVVFNAEMRVDLFGGLTGVGFFDTGNVFLRATDLDLTNLRPAAGFGIRYRSPIGPIRLDLGFNLDPRELVPGKLERRSVLHISLGQAF